MVLPEVRAGSADRVLDDLAVALDGALQLGHRELGEGLVHLVPLLDRLHRLQEVAEVEEGPSAEVEEVRREGTELPACWCRNQTHGA